MIQDDSTSTFSYDEEGDPDTFSLHELKSVVNSHFNTTCNLEKLAEGGYHKVYEIMCMDGLSLGVIRVAAPAFPKYKVESEVATLKYLAAHSCIPVPKVHAWNSDASNPVGAEYMIMEKVSGVPASDKWEKLSEIVKGRVVSQIADHLMAMFALRFDRAGSLYLSSLSGSDITVGPIVSTPFYRALDGFVRVPDTDATSFPELFCFRGPFSNTSDYLQSSLRAELHFLSHHRSIALSELDGEDEKAAISRLEQGQRVLRKAFELCAIYPGDIQIHQQTTAPTKLFSLRLDDFRLSNIMIDESGHVTGIIDFEGATIAPLWECAVLPRWLQDPDDPESTYEGGSTASRQALRALFLEKVGNVEWKKLYEWGKPFRLFSDRLDFQVGVWASEGMEAWVDERLAWATDHPGIGFPECHSAPQMNEC